MVVVLLAFKDARCIGCWRSGAEVSARVFVIGSERGGARGGGVGVVVDFSARLDFLD